MTEEISKQEEARRILDAIRHKEVAEDEEAVLPKPVSKIPEEEANQLKALIAQKLKLNTEIDEEQPLLEELPDPDNIDPISAQQIKVMRKAATFKEEEKRPLRTIIQEGIIKFYFDITDSIKLSVAKKRSCFKEGHQCIHCGKTVPFEALEYYLKKEKEKSEEEAKG